jgi:hypothetical protein
MDEPDLSILFKNLKSDIIEIKERLRAVEKEQRRIREDLLSGEAKERMQKRMLRNTQKDIKEVRKKLDEEIDIKI